MLAAGATSAGVLALLYEAFQYQPSGWVVLAAVLLFALGLVGVSDERASS